jgi:hypothetical protein
MKKILMPFLALVAVVGVGTSIYFYIQLSNAKVDPQKVAQEEANKLIAQVGKLIILPTAETPTIATVTDPEALKSQAFFANAQKGDKLLIYTNSKKAILYDPAQNIIVEVAPVNIGNQNQPAAAPSESSSSSAKK